MFERRTCSVLLLFDVSPGSSDRHQRVGGDGSSVLCSPAAAEEADGGPQPPTPSGFGERPHWDTV